MNASITITTQDIEAIQRVGHETIVVIVALVVETVLWTIYALLVAVAGYSLFIFNRRKGTIAMFFVIFAMFVLDCMLCVIDIRNAIVKVQLTLTSSSDSPYAERYNAVEKLPAAIIAAIYAWMSNLGDIIVIWRVYAFYRGPRERWLLVLPIALLLASTISSALLSDCAARLGNGIYAITDGEYVHPFFCRDIQRTSYLVTFLTTFVATSLILYKTWIYRQSVRSYLNSPKRKTRVENIMFILLESGLLYALFFLAAYIDSLPRISVLKNRTVALRFASTVWPYMTSHIVGIYPVLVLILVRSQRGYLETTANDLPTTLSGLNFAQRRSVVGASTTIPCAPPSSPYGPWSSSSCRSVGAASASDLRESRNAVAGEREVKTREAESV